MAAGISGQPEQGGDPDHTDNADRQAQGQDAANYQSVASNASNDPEMPRVQDAWLGEDEDGQDTLSDALDTMHLQAPYCDCLGEDYAAPRTNPAERDHVADILETSLDITQKEHARLQPTCSVSNAEL